MHQCSNRKYNMCGLSLAKPRKPAKMILTLQQTHNSFCEDVSEAVVKLLMTENVKHSRNRAYRPSAQHCPL